MAVACEGSSGSPSRSVARSAIMARASSMTEESSACRPWTSQRTSAISLRSWGAREDVQVGGAALMAVGFAEALEEVVGGGGLDRARHVEGWVAHVGAGPAADRQDGAALDGQASFLDVAVDGGGGESPQGDVFEGCFPAAPQRGRDRDFAGGLIEEGEVAVAAFDRRVGRAARSRRRRSRAGCGGRRGLARARRAGAGRSRVPRAWARVRRVAVHVDARAAADFGLSGQAWDVEGNVVVLVGLSEAVEDAGGRFEGGAGDLLVGAGDDPAVAGRVFDAGDGGELVAVGRRSQRAHAHPGHGGGGQGGQFEGALRGRHCFNVSRRGPGRASPRGWGLDCGIASLFLSQKLCYFRHIGFVCSEEAQRWKP